MTSWKKVLDEIQALKSQNAPGGDFDAVRRAKYNLVKSITGRPLLIYATAFHHPIKGRIAGPLLSIDLTDKDGFHEIIKDVQGSAIDVYIHSPGGSAEATESIVKMLRSKFKDIRFIVTGTAKSAATMLVLSGNSLLMDQAGELGPIDPQVRVKDRFSPAGSIIEQFDRAKEELKKHPASLPAWIPILQEFSPSLLVQCENFINLSETLVKQWLTDYMFAGEKDAESKAKKIATYLNDEKRTLSHARRIDIDQLKQLNVKVDSIDEMKEIEKEAIREMHLAIMLTLDFTGAIKLYENSEGAALVRIVQQQSQAQS